VKTTSQKQLFFSPPIFLYFFGLDPLTFLVLLLVQEFILYFFQYMNLSEERSSSMNGKEKRKILGGHIPIKEEYFNAKLMQ
jgi:hypothetical protein